MKVNKCSFTSNDDSLSFETNDQALVCSQLLEHAGKDFCCKPTEGQHTGLAAHRAPRAWDKASSKGTLPQQGRSWHCSCPDPSPSLAPVPAVAMAQWHLPPGGSQSCKLATKYSKSPLTEFLWQNPSDCSPGKVLPLWCNYSVKYGKLFLGMNSAKIWLVGQTP